MIFVTVGAQMSFDRMVGWVDDWATVAGREDVYAQIGPSNFAPKTLKVLPFLSPPEFRAKLAEADLIIAHAGMGSIINALELAKPILVVPRLATLEETRNDHQVATARHLAERGLVETADSPESLAEKIAKLEQSRSGAHISATAEGALLDRLRAFALA